LSHSIWRPVVNTKTPAALLRGENPGTHGTGGWLGPVLARKIWRK